MNNQLKTTFVILAVAIAAVFIANTVLVTTTQAFAVKKERLKEEAGVRKVRNNLPGQKRHL